MRNNIDLTLKKSTTDYTSSSSSRQTLVYATPTGNPIWISSVFSKGNSKLSKNILIFDLLAGIDCPNCAECIHTCYALKAQRQYPNTYNKRVINSYLARNSLKELKSLIVKELNKTYTPYVRIHSSGDFISDSYIRMWTSVCKLFSDVNFYYYTKVDSMFNFNSLKSLPNVNQVNSILPDGSINFGSIDYISNKAELFDIPICPAIRIPTFKCGESCTHCMNSPYILFEKH